MLRYLIPTLQEHPQVERICPYCQHPAARIHQQRASAITDTRLGAVGKLRMRCRNCRRTFTLLPTGLSPHAQRAQRVRALNLLL